MGVVARALRYIEFFSGDFLKVVQDLESGLWYVAELGKRVAGPFNTPEEALAALAAEENNRFYEGEGNTGDSPKG